MQKFCKESCKMKTIVSKKKKKKKGANNVVRFEMRTGK